MTQTDPSQARVIPTLLLQTTCIQFSHNVLGLSLEALGAGHRQDALRVARWSVHTHGAVLESNL